MSILGEVQTFIGVLATFIVLCLFKDNTNFLNRIICEIGDELQKSLANNIAVLKREIRNIYIHDDANEDKSQDEGVVEDFDFWRKISTEEEIQELLINQKETALEENLFFTESTKIVKEYTKQLTLFQDRKDDMHVSLFILILIIFILTIDCLGLDFKFTIPFLTLIISVSSFYTFTLWKNYSQIQITENRHESLKLTQCLYRGIGSIIIAYILWSITLLFVNTTWINYITYISLLFIFLNSLTNKKTQNFHNSINYNKQFISKHTIYITLICLLLSLFTYFATSCSTISEYLVTTNIDPQILYNWTSNMNNFFTPKMIRICLVLFFVSNSFFIPIIIGYTHNRILAKQANMQINKEKELRLNNINKKKEEYSKIVNKIRCRIKKTKNT